MREVEHEGCTYLGIVKLGKIKENEMKDNITREYKRRLRLILRSKLNGWNKITEMNTWAVAILQYGDGLLDWRDREIKCLDRGTREHMTMHGSFHPNHGVDR